MATPVPSPAFMQPAVIEHYRSLCGTPTPPPARNGDTASTTNTSKMITALKWITAIQEATQCLRDQAQSDISIEDEKEVGSVRQSHSVKVTEHALVYLMRLEALLHPLEAEWDQAPHFDPPVFEPYKIPKKTTTEPRGDKNKKRKGRSANNVDQSPTSVVSNWAPQEQWTKVNVSSNRFASLHDDDDESDDEESETGTPTTSSRATTEDLDDLQEAGDVPTLNRIAEFPTGTIFVMRRLMIRIVTAQSELFAFQASVYRKASNWSLGAETCHASLWKIHQGLLLADTEISRCLSEVGGSPLERQPLMEDAGIVEVAVKSLTQERDSFVQKALVKKRQLMRKLEEVYIARTKARLRLGESKWCGNYRRNEHRAHQRAKHEELLVEIQLALDHMLQLDTRSLVHSTDQLKLRLQHQPLSCYPIHRHNKQRPSDYVSKRVSYEEYPDPSYFDWKFTGTYCEGGSHLEFYEKQGMLLDFDFVTKKLELSWLHLSRRGNTTFFRSPGPTPSKLYLGLLESTQPWKVAAEHKKMQAAMPGNTTRVAPAQNYHQWKVPSGAEMV
ncbi:expressed unknown protein [Seminavis robusta]|uniref:Uncharacterized protein n=1 Tax=Seminavis robusta TaxID=568900 RepID=A0A9N8H240_9STRA|nr:expressed unknown protein [Seminavis robusta]|eukprot:Sro56_g032790.1 n/a (557) ;mRNA; f:68310-70153